MKLHDSIVITHPELVKELHPTKNGSLNPAEISTRSNLKVWWYLPYDDPITGRHFDFEWQALVCHRTRGIGCPYLSNGKLWVGYNDLATTNPELAKQWHPTRNGNLKPTDVMAGSHKKVWWYLPYDDSVTGKHFDFEWEAMIKHRNSGVLCPFLTGNAVWMGFNDFASRYPKIAVEWHPTKNGDLKPSDFTYGSHKIVWWFLPYTDPDTGKYYEFEWKMSIHNRSIGYGCPYLTTSRTEKLIHNFLDNNSVNFEIEKKINGCKNIRNLPFDFVLSDYNCIIEVDGKQHFQKIHYWGGKTGFQYRVLHDNIKNDFCKSQNIPLLRIPYIYDPVVDKDKIEKFVLDFTQTKQVPQEIKEFYAKYPFSSYCK